MGAEHTGEERRQFLRYDYEKSLHFSILNSSKDKNFLSKSMEAISKNLSASGILFVTNIVPEISSFLVLDLDYRTARICQEIESRALIINNKLIGRVVRIEENDNGLFDIGLAFVTKGDRLPQDIQNLIS